MKMLAMLFMKPQTGLPCCFVSTTTTNESVVIRRKARDTLYSISQVSVRQILARELKYLPKYNWVQPLPLNDDCCLRPSSDPTLLPPLRLACHHSRMVAILIAVKVI